MLIDSKHRCGREAIYAYIFDKYGSHSPTSIFFVCTLQLFKKKFFWELEIYF